MNSLIHLPYLVYTCQALLNSDNMATQTNPCPFNTHFILGEGGWILVSMGFIKSEFQSNLASDRITVLTQYILYFQALFPMLYIY